MSASVLQPLLGEIETPRPLRATEEQCTITGWCLLNNHPETPPVRLTTKAGILPMTARTVRTDIPKRLPGQPAAARCGFLIEGRLPAGVHLAAFEAQLPDGSWQIFKTLIIAVARTPLYAGIESPFKEGTVNLRVQVEGWALHSTQPIKALSLRYGHQEIPCTYGGKRADVPLLHPEIPQAAGAGFTSEIILSAGRGPLRLKARLADGSLAIARTALTIAVRSDENIGAEIDLAGARIPLPGYSGHDAIRRENKSARTRNVLFVLHGSFSSNSALHVAALANELSGLDCDCAVAVPHDPATLSHHDQPAFRGLTFEEAEHDLLFENGRGPDIIHAWTTRENVRRLTEKLRARHQAKVVVHLEDNEQEILSCALQLSRHELAKLSSAALDQQVPENLSHPHHSREFLAQAHGITVIADRLREFAPAGRPCQLIVPAADARHFFPRPMPQEFRRLCDLKPGTTLLFYHGNIHPANAAEVKELYAAVLRLNEQGHPTTLLRTGLDRVDFLGPIAPNVAPYVIELGQILHHRHLPPLMALADIFVQPGEPDAFNDYRFPSKLPEFFSIGRPVVLPRTNLGTQLRHGTDAYVLDRADAAGITHAIIALRQDRALYDRLSQGALAYAEKHFSWRRSAETLAKFYSTLTA
jgi:glycosyltransferase involved in cell wall biosynthesis